MKKIMMAVCAMMFAAVFLFAEGPVTGTAKSGPEVPGVVIYRAAPAAVSAVSVPEAAAVTLAAAAEPAKITEAMTPPAPEALEGAFEQPGEPVPSADEASGRPEKKNYRKDKHFTIEQTLYTPSAFGTRLGYFINENWRVIGEFSTVSGLIANFSKEKNISWAVGGNYSPADDDLSPFFGADFSSVDIVYNSKSGGDTIKNTKTFTGGVLCAGVTWITGSPLLLSLEFDLYGGKYDEKQNNATTESIWTLSVMIGGGVGLVF